METNQRSYFLFLSLFVLDFVPALCHLRVVRRDTREWLQRSRSHGFLCWLRRPQRGICGIFGLRGTRRSTNDRSSGARGLGCTVTRRFILRSYFPFLQAASRRQGPRLLRKLLSFSFFTILHLFPSINIISLHN